MKESIKTVFQCDFCDKRLFRKNAMENHESKCKSNPLNKDACHGCSFCQEIEVEYTFDGYSGGYYFEETRSTKGFKCTKLNKELYPHKAEYLAERYPEHFYDKEVMPNECEHHEFIF